jgi:hypothetical protein
MSSSRQSQIAIALITSYLSVSVSHAQPPNGQPSVAVKNASPASKPADGGAAPAWQDALDKHPLVPALRWAKEALPRIEEIDSYTAKLTKRERIAGRLATETLALKISNKPFSIYLRYLAPRSSKGEEVIYVEGANSGKMWAHGAGIRGLAGTLALEPTDPLAMHGEHYPLTEIGILKLVERLVSVAEKDVKFGECSMKWIDHAKINDRTCHCIEVVHPRPRKDFDFHLARVFVDDEMNIPVRYECYDWPSVPGDKPPLMEEYTYFDIRLGAGLSAADFDVQNQAYHFRPASHETAAKR